MKSKLIRIFVAFPAPELIIRAFKEFTADMNEIPGLRWTRESNLHLTLFFIGEIKPENLSEVVSRLKPVHSAFTPFELVFEKISFRGKITAPEMIWAQFEKSESFTKLTIGIHETLKDMMTIRVQHRDPIPHITLARLKKGLELDYLRARKDSFPQKITVDKMEL